MVWRIREAQKGKVRIGPRLARAHDAEVTKVLPVRVPAAAAAPSTGSGAASGSGAATR